ncbi:MAG: hypothetical protein F4X98_03425, partial [Gammaproteobacteria bacterium]|nr:hypothetical protein [Gammaproteobacteria bacterium]
MEPALVEVVLGFTPAAAAIAVLLAEGRTLRQIAAATGRGYSTVQTHLRHTFAKLGCSRQLEVVQPVEALSKLPASRGSAAKTELVPATKAEVPLLRLGESCHHDHGSGPARGRHEETCADGPGNGRGACGPRRDHGSPPGSGGSSDS